MKRTQITPHGRSPNGVKRREGERKKPNLHHMAFSETATAQCRCIVKCRVMYMKRTQITPHGNTFDKKCSARWLTNSAHFLSLCNYLGWKAENMPRVPHCQICGTTAYLRRCVVTGWVLGVVSTGLVCGLSCWVGCCCGQPVCGGFLR